MDACIEIENRLDSIAGVHVRRYYYSESLVEYPKSVRDFYMKDFSFPKKALFYVMWGVIQKRMIVQGLFTYIKKFFIYRFQ